MKQQHLFGECFSPLTLEPQHVVVRGYLVQVLGFEVAPGPFRAGIEPGPPAFKAFSLAH